MTTRAGLSLRGACGHDVPYRERDRGRVVRCACGAHYRAPPRPSVMRRALERIRFALLWLRAGSRARPRAALDGPSPGPYRVLGEGERVRCPACGRAPEAGTAWQCSYCHWSWDTFATRGVCPGCAAHYPVTQCFGCHAMSRHEDWYER